MAAEAAGSGYATLAVAILVIGGVRQNHVAAALRRGSHDQLSASLVTWLTVAAVVLALATLAVVAIAV